MPSLRSRILVFTMKNRHLFRLRFRKEKTDWTSPDTILRFRRQCEEGAERFGKIPKGIEVTPVSVAGLHAEWIQPEGSLRDKVIFFLHGGGYVSGSCADHRIHVAKFVRGTGIAALLYEYRLAPEHPFPAALDDSVRAYQWLLDQGTLPSNIVFAGDSAGGGLCLTTLLALKDRQAPLPAAAVVLSPWTDLTCSGQSYRTNARKCLSPEGTWTAFSRHYVGDYDPRDPLISPLYGELRGLPPILVYVGENEIFYDDSVSFAHKAEEAGVDITLRVGKGLFHCYPVCAPLFPEATMAMKEINGFIKMRLVSEPAIDLAGDAAGSMTNRQDGKDTR